MIPLCLICVLLLLSVFSTSQAAYIEPRTSTPLRPFSINQDYVTDYSFRFYVPTMIPSSASFEVEFPLPYQLPSACGSYLKYGDGDFAAFSCEKISSFQYVVSLDQINVGEYELVFENIRNPADYPASSNFKIRTYFNNEILVDSNDYFDSVPFYATPLISNGATVKNIGYTNVNLGSKFDWNFTLTKSLKKGDSIKFNFPEGFSFKAPACFHRNSGSYAESETLFDNRMVICKSFAFPMEAGVLQTVTIIGVLNPDHSGFYRGFSLETMEDTFPNIYEAINVLPPLKIDTGAIDVELTSESLLRYVNTTHIINMVFDDQVPEGDQVWIRIPSDFRYLAGNCTLLRPIQPANEDSEVSCGIAANGTGYVIQGFAEIAIGQLITVEISAENPIVSATYTIDVYSFSPQYQAKIDSGSAQISITENFGSSKFFKSHALRWTRRLKYNETGPLEFTFFLNIPLPATYSTFEGKIVVDITPQIPDPGNVSCYFYETIQAACQYNTSNPNMTTVTIYTPTTASYFDSEIPITITTNEKQGNAGLKLPELIQRYKFYVYFFRNKEASFHEIYYDNYVPDPIIMDSTWLTPVIAPLQYGKEAYIRFTWINKYIDLGTNYFFEIQFKHVNQAWDFNLGWPSSAWYQKYKIPCIIENLGNDYECILRPGSALNTLTTIQVIGLSAIPKSADGVTPTAVLHFPKILFGSKGIAYMRFGLYQNTAGEDTKNIPIMYQDLQFQPQAAKTVTSTAGLTVALQSVTKVNETSTLSLSLTSTVKPAFVIYEYPVLFTFTNPIMDCGNTNKCYIFNGSVGWIVYETSSTSSSVTVAPSVTTPPYVDTFDFQATTVKSDGTVGEIKTGSVDTTSGSPFVTIKANSTNVEINRNSILLFDVSFTTQTYLPDDSSILFTFASMTVPDTDSLYCIISGLTARDAEEVTCERTTIRTYKIYNIKEVLVGTTIKATLQGQVTTSNPVGATIYTYYYRNNTMLVDSGTNGVQLTLKYNNFYVANFFNNRSGQVVRAGNAGILSINLTTSAAVSTATISFGNNFTKTSTRDLPICRSNTTRKYCAYSSARPLNIYWQSLTTAPLITKETNTLLSVSTDYSIPSQKGALASSTAGWYPVFLTLTNSASAASASQKVGDFLYIYPNSIPDFYVEATPITANQPAMYTFHIRLNKTINSNTDTKTRGRIFIDFPIGEGYFAKDLGTGKLPGEYLGCNIDGLQGTIDCRLLPSPAGNLSTTVELIGFSKLSNINTNITIRIANIYNPVNTTGEYLFTLRTEHVTVSTGDITPLEYTTFSFWHNVQELSSTFQTITAPSDASFASGTTLGQAAGTLNIIMYSTFDLSAGDYYACQLPSDIVPSSTISAPSGMDLYLSFPDTNWVVYRLNAAQSANTARQIAINSVTVPDNFPQLGFEITCYVWKSDALVEIVNFNTTTVSGTISGVTIVVDPEALVRNRVNTEFLVGFTTGHIVPAGGSIEIRFPTGFKPHANCQSISEAGSKLTSTTGRVACTATKSSWVLTNFDRLAVSSTVQVYGLVDLPDTSGTTESLGIYTYANQVDDLSVNGEKIDEVTSGYTFTISTWDTLSLETNATVRVNQEIRAKSSNYQPLVFEFSTKTNAVSAGSSVALLVKTSTGGFSSSQRTDASTICYFINLATSENIACSYSYSSTSGVGTHTLIPLKALAAATEFQAVITTVFASSGNDGVAFPSTAGVYPTAIKVQAGSSSQTDLTFFEVLPSDFSSLTVTNYMISEPDDDIIDINFKVSSSISTSTRVIVELPTMFNDTAMFADDLGQGLTDGQDKNCDVVSSAPSGLTMSCFFQKGNQIAGTPATIVLYGFSAAFTQLRFAFTVQTPSFTTPTAIPLTIYTLQGTKTFTKTYYRYVEQAILVLSSTPQTSTETTAPSYSSQSLQTSTSLSITMNPSKSMSSPDFYVIKAPQMSSVATGSTQTRTLAGLGSVIVSILPKNSFIILQPSSSVTDGSSYTLTIPSVYTPDVTLSASDRQFTGFFAYFSKMDREKVTYSSTANSFNALSSFPTSPTVSATTTLINQNSILTFTINAIFKNVESVIIDLGSRVSVGVDCYEAPSSTIPIFSCSPDTTNNLAVITLENQTYSSTAQNLVVSVAVTNGGTTGTVSAFTYYLYSSTQTDASSTADLVYSVQASPGITLTSPSQGGGQLPTLAEFSYVPFAETTFGSDSASNTNADITFTVTLKNDFASGYAIIMTAENFALTFLSQSFGDVSSQPAMLIYAQNTYALALATYSSSSDTLTFKVPSALGTLSAGTQVTFKIVQVSRMGDYSGIQTDITDSSQQYNVSIGVYTSNAQISNGVPRDFYNNIVIDRVVKTIGSTRTPIRVKFELTSSLSAGSGTVVLDLPSNEFNYDTSSTVVCVFKTYRGSGLLYTESTATCRISGSLTQGFVITAVTDVTLSANVIHELVVSTTGSSSPNFNQFSGSSKQLVVSFSNGGNDIAFKNINLYQFQTSALVKISDFYYTSVYSSDPDTLILALTTSTNVAAFPSSLIEFELTSASSSIIKNGLSASERNLTCGIVGLSMRSSSNSNLRCILVQDSPPKVRIENYDAISSGTTFYVMLYDLDNSVIAADFVSYFDFKVLYTAVADKTQSQHQLTRLFRATSGTGQTSASQSGVLSSSATTYGVSTTLSSSLTWTSSNQCTNCRIIGQGTSIPWQFKDGGLSLTIAGSSQSLLIDSVNNIFVVLQSSSDLTQGTYRFSFQGSNVRTPYPYEATTETIQLQFISGQASARTISLNLASSSLSVATTSSSPTISCTSFGSIVAGSNGTVDCSVTIPLSSSILPIEAATVSFPNTNSQQLGEIYNYCNAYLSSSTPLQGQLVCSRQDTVENQPVFFFTGFTKGTSDSLTFTFRARALSTSITANVALQVLYEGQYSTINQRQGVSLSVSTVVSTSGISPSLFSLSSSSAISSVDSSTQAPLRVLLNIEEALTAGDSIILTLGSGFSGASSVPLCSIRSSGGYGAPVILQGSYSSTNNAFTMTLLNSLDAGSYLVEVKNILKDTANEGFSYSSRTDMIVEILSSSGTIIARDIAYITPAPSADLTTFQIIQLNKIASSNSQFNISLQVPSAVSVGSDTLLVLEFPTSVYDSDLGASTTTFARDNLPYYNGMALPSVLPSAFGTNASLQYGANSDPALVIIPITQSFTTTVNSISLAYIKNPGDYTGSSIKASIVNYATVTSNGVTKVQPNVLYEASYTNYFNTILNDTSTTSSSSLTASYSSLTPSQSVTITLSGKNYGTTVNTTSSEIYIKLLNQANGFNYNIMTGIQCDGYQVTWHKAGYIFFLAPTSDKTATPTIVCSGFILGSEVESLGIETGIYKDGYRKVVASSTTAHMQAFGSISGDILTATRLDSVNDLTTIYSVNRYIVSYDPASFALEAGSSLVLVIPTGLVLLQDRLKYVNVSGLLDYNSASLNTSVYANMTSNNAIMISGYQTYSKDNGVIKIQLFLQNNQTGDFKFQLLVYGKNGKQVAQSSSANSVAVTVSAGSNFLYNISFASFLTDEVDVYAGEQYPLAFQVQVRNALTASASSYFQVTLPSNWTIPSDQTFVCKYSKDFGVHWIRSSSCSQTGNNITIPIVKGFDINQTDTISILLTTNSSNTATLGYYRSSSPVIHTFNVRSHSGTSDLESAFIPIMINPNPNDVATATFYTIGATDSGIIGVSYTASQDILSTDYFELDLATYDELFSIFPYAKATTEVDKRILGNCGDNPTIASISNNATIDCFIEKSKTTNASVPAKLIIRGQNNISAGSTVNFFVANITNPARGINAFYVVNVKRPCRDDGLGCPIMRTRNYFTVGAASSPLSKNMSRPTLESGKKFLFTDQVNTIFTISADYSVTSSDAIVFKTSMLNVVQTSECQTSSGMCLHFPQLGWTFYQPTSTFTSGTITISLDNAIFYDRSNQIGFSAEIWTSNKIQEIFYSYHPDYSVMVPGLLTTPTQSEPNILQIVRNYDNILQITMSGIWRTALVSRIIVNIPSTYAPIKDYCQVGVNLNNMSNTSFMEFACQKVNGTDRQILIVINEAWQEGYENYPVILYYRGFLTNEVSLIGRTSSSTITSYASLTNNWVIDENTGYSFIVSPIPTPIVRNTTFNLKSYYDRQANINDSVEIYGAIWPNTGYNASNASTQITSMIFEIADEFAYPSLINMICDTKAIFAELLTCRLKRTKGRTLIYSNMPSYYAHSPFLFRITNINESLLFRAPEREGYYLFNITFLNAQGQVVEKSDSYINITGGFVSNFTAEPMVLDPLVVSAYDIEFITGDRLVPQGFYSEDVSVYTQIVLYFQTYSPGFPYDLGSGLANNSEISCLPVSGIQVSETGKLTCTLIYGNANGYAQIIITGYDNITADTGVRILLDQIETLQISKTSRIRLEIDSHYTGISEDYIFYNSLEVTPQATSASIANAATTMKIEAPGTSTIRGTISYKFSLTTTTALTANRDYIIIEFPEDAYETDTDYSQVQVSLSNPELASNSYIMPLRNVIYIEPTERVAAGALEITVTDLPSPSYYLDGSLSFTIKTVVGSKVIDVFTNSVEYTSTVCQLFGDAEVIPSSNFTRVNENTYQVSFTVNHVIPPTGSLAIIFDKELYNLRPSNPQCQIVKGLTEQATCGFELFSEELVRISLNGDSITPGTLVQINILGVNNPTITTQQPIITIQSYDDDRFGTNKVICSKNVTLPYFLQTDIILCPVAIRPVINNANEVTDYMVDIFCTSEMKNATTVEIEFPSAYEDRFSSSGMSCATNGNYMLGQCGQIARTNLVRVLVSEPLENLVKLTIRVRDIKNPSIPNIYDGFNVKLYQYEVLYGNTDVEKSEVEVQIKLNQNLQKKDDLTSLSIFPRNYGEEATYYFELVRLHFISLPETLLIEFDEKFSSTLGNNLTCGTFTPEEQYGESYSLNYEAMQNHKPFECSIIDDYLINITFGENLDLQLQAPSQSIFFYINGIYNPNILFMSRIAEIQTSYSFRFTFITQGVALVISNTAQKIQFGDPPTLLKMLNTTASDNNILVNANYNFSLFSYADLPSSNAFLDYEIMLAFPVSRYPDSSFTPQLTFSFPEYSAIEAQSYLTKYNSTLFIDAIYPNLKTINSFPISLYNILNPSTPSDCDSIYPSDLLNIGVKYVSRTYGFIYGKNYNIMDKYNCLTIGEFRNEIQVNIPQTLRQGLVYNVSIQIAKATTSLSLTPISDSLIFEPMTVNFGNFTGTTQTLSIYVPRNIQLGNYSILWKKTESSQPARFTEVPNSNLVVIAANAGSAETPLGKVTVQDFNSITIGQYPQNVTVTLDKAPAEQLILKIQSEASDDDSLQVSTDTETYSQLPAYLTFGRGESQKQFYIFATTGAVNNTLTYELSGTNAQAYDPIVVSSSYVVENTTEAEESQLNFTEIKQASVQENNVSYNIVLPQEGVVYYMAVIQSIISPTKAQLISGEIPDVDAKSYIAGELLINTEAENETFTGSIQISGLRSQTDYQVYFLARDNFGVYSQIKTLNLTTSEATPGASILMYTRGNLNASTILNALSEILAIHPSKLFVESINLASLQPYNQAIQEEEEEEETSSSSNSIASQLFGGQLSSYKFGIKPDLYNNSPSPTQIANQIFTQANQEKLFELIPEYAFDLGTRVAPILGDFVEYITQPSVESVSYYTITISAELMEPGRLYGIAIPSSKSGNYTPTSYQISQGWTPNNTQLDESYFNMTVSDDSGRAVLVLDELREHVEYDIYVTAGDNLPYEPVNLIKNENVVVLTAKTLKNPNVGNTVESVSLYNEYYEPDESFGGRLKIGLTLIILLVCVIL